MPRRSLKEERALSAAKLEAEKNGETVEAESDAYMAAKCKIIGRNVRLERKKRKFSIDNLAECIELSASYVGLLERGDRCPSLKSLLKLCELFNVDPNELLLEKPSGSKMSDTMNTADISEEKRRNNYSAVISLLHGLDEAELECVVTSVKALRKLRKMDEIGLEAGVVSYASKKPAKKM